MKYLLSLPSLVFGILVLLILALTFDLFQSNSKYLYFTTEIGLIVISIGLYLECFKNTKWSDPSPQKHRLPKLDWKQHAKVLIIYFFVLGGVLCCVWFMEKYYHQESTREWWRSGAWYLYYVVIFGIFYIVTHKHLQFVNFKAIIISVAILLPVLVGYEAILLSEGTGWKYNHSVIGWILDVPVDNILFVYPIAPALCIVLFTMTARYFNDLKAFWLIMSFLIPASIVVELIGIYPPLDLWDVFNDKSIWPMGKTNIEEFIYYIIFQLMAILLYIFFDTHLVEGQRVRG